MYVKVHKKNNRWFRLDNGTLVGDAVSPGNLLETLQQIHGSDKYFVVEKRKKQIVIVYHGYYDNNGVFNHFCKKDTCHGCDAYTKEHFCYKRLRLHKNAGYYIKT